MPFCSCTANKSIATVEEGKVMQIKMFQILLRSASSPVLKSHQYGDRILKDGMETRICPIFGEKYGILREDSISRQGNMSVAIYFELISQGYQ